VQCAICIYIYISLYIDIGMTSLYIDIGIGMTSLYMYRYNTYMYDLHKGFVLVVLLRRLRVDRLARGSG
jgi:hypothetical protein